MFKINKIIIASLCFVTCLNQVQASNSVVATVPSVQNWVGGSGVYTAIDGAKVIINSDATKTSSTVAGITTTSSETASHLIQDLLATTALNYSVVNSNVTGTGDILLTLLNTPDAAIGDEGYIVEIGSAIEIKANTNTGLYYGTQSILQALKSDVNHSAINQGVITDYPSLPERGIMIDAGRKFWQMDYLKDLIRTLGWQKMNRLHLHFTEWNAFRLASDKPSLNGLAAIGSYTKEQIDELEALAKKHHVVIVPEIDIPGHAKLLGDFSKADAFTCASLSTPNYGWEGASGPRWTIDYTGVSTNSPNTGRDFINELVDEFVPWFDGPYFHIGTDEVPEGGKLSSCAELTHYVADTPSLSRNGDVLVEFIDEVNGRIKSLGKKTQMWNWYERESSSIEPVNDVLIDVWAGNAENDYINLGFDVIKTGAGGFYLTPGFASTFPSDNTIYTWNGTTSPHLKGVKVSVWTDTAYTWPDQQFEGLMFDSRAVSAERNWFGVNTGSADNFLTKARELGQPSTITGEKNALSKENWAIANPVSEEVSGEDGQASNTFDGLGTTIWHTKWSSGSDSFPYNLDIDLGGTFDLYGARFQARRNQGRDLNGLVDTYDFYTSIDGQNWTAAKLNGSFFDLVNERKAREISFAKQTAKYVRFVAKSATNGERYAALAELDLFGTEIGGAPIEREFADMQMRPKTDMSYCMGINRDSGNATNGDITEMRSCHNVDVSQIWQRREEGNGYISIRLSSNTNKCLDVNRGADQIINAGDEILIWDCHLGDNQLWKVAGTDYGFFNIQSKGESSVCLDINSASASALVSNETISLQTCSSKHNQQWVLVE